ncbi:MAG: tripartite tricarboxylate transporter TctB family protein [Deltaproteobacteria bacterium]
MGKAMVEKQRGMPEGIFWVVIGGIICVLAFQHGLGSIRAPGPGFVAFLSGSLVGGVGIVMILSKSIATGRAKGTIRDKGLGIPGVSLRRLVYTMTFLVAYAILMDPLGYIVSTFLAMFGLFFDREKKNWLWSLFFSVTASLVSYLVFEVWLHCQLPRGILPWW